jgi:DNA-binding MarR family transcriptional regulator
MPKDMPPVGILIDSIYYLVNRTIAERLHEAGFTEIRPAHSKVFENLGGGRHVSELAEWAQVTKQSMAELVEYLEKYEFVERVPDPADRRAKIVRLTPRGHEAVAAAQSILEEIYADWSRLLGPKRFANLQRMLYEIVTRENRG